MLRETPAPVHPARVRAASRALLDTPAASLAEQVRIVFCEPTRAQILRALTTGRMCVSDLVRVIGQGRTAVSKHLAVLLRAGFVTRTRRGRMVYYSLSNGPAALVAAQALEAVAHAAS